MKIKALQIKNYRIFENETIAFDDYTVMVGANGVGKSTVLSALNVLFREKDNSTTDTTYLDQQDFHNGNSDDPVEIIATFADLGDIAADDLRHYVRQDLLIVAAVAHYDKISGRAEVKQYGERLAMQDFALFFSAQSEGKKVADLKQIYQEIRDKYSDLPVGGTNASMTDALQEYEAQHPDLCIPIRSADNFYGARKGRLDPYIQWVYVPAVKDARVEQFEGKNSALGKLLSRTVRAKTNFDEQVEKLRDQAAAAYDNFLKENQSALVEISESLSGRLKEWSHSEAKLRLIWSQDAEKSVRIDPPFAKAVAGEAGFEGDIVRMGHGLQRSFILAILNELAATNDSFIPTLLLGVEEPELYQHPPQARYLASVLLKIASGNSQVLVTTHNPLFAPGHGFEHIRMFRRHESGGVVHSFASLQSVADEVAKLSGSAQIKVAGIRARINQALMWSLSEMFFANKLIFVEGAEDVAYLTAYLQAIDLLDSFRAKGASIVACANKSGMIQAAAIAKCLKIPFFLIWDCDGQVTNQHQRSKHELDNLALLKAVSSKDSNAFPPDNVFDVNHVCWSEEITSVVRNDLGGDWQEINNAAHNSCGSAPNLGKNSLYISELMIEIFERKKVLPELDKAISSIRKFAGV